MKTILALVALLIGTSPSHGHVLHMFPDHYWLEFIQAVNSISWSLLTNQISEHDIIPHGYFYTNQVFSKSPTCLA